MHNKLSCWIKNFGKRNRQELETTLTKCKRVLNHHPCAVDINEFPISELLIELIHQSHKPSVEESNCLVHTNYTNCGICAVQTHCLWDAAYVSHSRQDKFSCSIIVQSLEIIIEKRKKINSWALVRKIYSKKLTVICSENWVTRALAYASRVKVLLVG